MNGDFRLPVNPVSCESANNGVQVKLDAGLKPAAKASAVVAGRKNISVLGVQQVLKGLETTSSWLQKMVSRSGPRV